MNHPFYDFLAERIERALPGKSSQLKMQPIPIDDGFNFPEPDSSDGHPSSVLIPLYHDKSDILKVILTLRTDSIRHAGQISFPGGRSDNDESPIDTALRETREEIGIPHRSISIIGSISPLYLYRSNNQITPVIGFLNEKPEFKPNPAEVQEVISVSLETLLNQDTLIWETWQLRNISCKVPYWNIHSTPLWGATAMIMSELLDLYREFLDVNNRNP
jgi:8-oxo-dGTP pyrophosphatase MutT (NUDIX family)